MTTASKDPGLLRHKIEGNPVTRRIVFITGGARSGKSSFVLREAEKFSGRKVYIATAEARDEEMRERIEAHQKMRGKDWDTCEEPLKISGLLRETYDRYQVIVVDCLTLWLSNVMHAGMNPGHEIDCLISSLTTHHSSLLFIVSNEVGMGIVPENEMARRFRDVAGVLNQKVAEVSDEIYLLIAGLPVKIRGEKEL
jgi:adenosylcobinamide kinase/adenosylcobinamide-phosphate guanylyltransferase